MLKNLETVLQNHKIRAIGHMYTKIMEGKSQADNGQLLDGQSTMEKLRKKYVEQV